MTDKENIGGNVVPVGVVIVNWRNAADTLVCLESLVAADPRPTRVVVVENGSGDDSFDRLLAWAARRSISFECLKAGRGSSPNADSRPWLSIVRTEGNRGFAGGNNVGLALLERERPLTHFLLLNNDAIVSADYFAEMQQVLDRDPRAGLCTGTIYELSDRARVWYAGGRMLPLRALAIHELRLPPTDEPTETAFVTGCAMVISRAALQEVGFLAECYFPGYMEDAEYSWRVRRSGFKLVYAPRPRVYHKVGASFGARASSPLAAYHQNRHRLYFVRRNLHGLRRLTAIAYMIVTKPGRALVDVLTGRPRIAWATLSGTWAGLTTPRRRFCTDDHNVQLTSADDGARN